MANTFILTWNPTQWHWPEDHFNAAVDRTAVGKKVRDQWSVGSRRHGIEPGDRAFLFRLHADRGIVASAVFTSTIESQPHWDNSGRDASYAKLAWDTVLIADQRLPVEILNRRVAGVAWDRLQGSGVLVEPNDAVKLEVQWARHLDAVVYSSPEEVTASASYVEGAVTQVLANRYERNRRARQACVDHWGATCSVCEFDFGASYGKLGKNFIHVHHLRELAQIGAEYVVDPVKDLRPVCPNCHAMLHNVSPTLTIAALKKRLRRQ